MRRMRSAVAAAVLASALCLSGCSASPAEIATSTSILMQSTIVAAARQADAGDAAGALATIDSLQAQLQQASTTGEISAIRAATIQQAIDLVRTDLKLALPTTPTPEEVGPITTTEPDVTTPETTPVSPGDDNGNDGNANGNGNNGNNGNSGNNGNNGNGNNGKGKDK